MLNSPAWPATPPIFAARGSCTSPLSHLPSRLLGRCRAGLQLVRRQVAGVLHAELVEDFFLRRIRLTGLPATASTILPSRMKLTSEYLNAVPGSESSFKSQIFGFGRLPAVVVIAERIVGNQARRMDEQVLDRDVFLAVGGELGKELRHLVVRAAAGRARRES